jgi:hypothetical protein
MRQAIAIFCTLIVPGAATLAQNGPPAPQSTPLLSPDQLDNLVAPIALYPDPLLAQVLAASTYPLEIIEAQQWLNQNRGLSGQALIDAAKRQNWDPSVAALVAFPDALTLLSGDIQWTTDLGNAFLAQQADVMSAIQRMRARAEQNGRLQSTAQQTVTGDPGAIQIQPANPQVVYVPVYNPVYVWGPPDWGAYPALWYPPVSYGCGFGVGVLLGGLFAGFLGFGGWGWGVSWLAHGLFLNGLFFSHFGFGGSYGFAGRTWWAHDPVHRMGVAYPNRALAARYGGTGRPYSGRFSERAYAANRTYGGTRNFAGGSRAPGGNFRNYSGTGNFGGNYSYRAPQQSFNPRNFGNAYRAPQQSFRGFAPGNNRSFAPRSNPRGFSAPHYSAPRASGGGRFGGGGHSGGGHFGGGHSGGGSRRR